MSYTNSTPKAYDITTTDGADTYINRTTYITTMQLHQSNAKGYIILKDGDSTGEVLFKYNTAGGDQSIFLNFSSPLKFKNGVYVEHSKLKATIGYFK